MADLDGKVALVTGGTGGIGRGVAMALAGRGAHVVINGRSAEKAAAAIAEIEALGAKAVFAPGDVRDKADMEAAVETAVQTFGGLDIVVPNAGGSDDEARSPEVRGPFPGIDLEQVAGFVGRALLGKLRVVQAAIPALRQRGGGSVVFVTSEGGRVPTPGQTGISAFSAGLIQVSKLLSRELAPEKIRVNCVCVTLVRNSPSWEAAFEREGAVSEHHRKQYQRVIQRSPLGVAAPADIGNVVAFLASSDADYLTGAVLSPTGGLTLH
ncbi:SDR family oxidoreductase (plasmid) [Paracoccus versutus]|nr:MULTISPECIES: SDR family NAD(P)-dependent oxidoreductase [Paracoccus]KGJ08068.1 3-oxoacyl-ACP reductase [Paracoccus versutus]MBT0781253.1 SDR family oxidoreductase [Paracoccus sp. pheM1]WEJ81366.1 SDR family oxidoreductase [Paracoccus versutus]